jgi:hypothetical protein
LQLAPASNLVFSWIAAFLQMLSCVFFADALACVFCADTAPVALALHESNLCDAIFDMLSHAVTANIDTFHPSTCGGIVHQADCSQQNLRRNFACGSSLVELELCNSKTNWLCGLRLDLMLWVG